jgi:hypothetical protein
VLVGLFNRCRFAWNLFEGGEKLAKENGIVGLSRFKTKEYVGIMFGEGTITSTHIVAACCAVLYLA